MLVWHDQTFCKPEHSTKPECADCFRRFDKLKYSDYATEDSVDNALYVAEFLYNNMKAALRAEKRKARERFRLVCEPDFYCGFMSGICSALKKRETEIFAENESYAIICQTELALVEEYLQREVKPKEVHTHNPLKDYESFNRGYERGQNTTIKPAIA